MNDYMLMKLKISLAMSNKLHMNHRFVIVEFIIVMPAIKLLVMAKQFDVDKNLLYLTNNTIK